MKPRSDGRLVDAEPHTVVAPGYIGPDRRGPGRPWARRDPASGDRAMRRVRTGADSHATPVRRLLHAVAGIASWVLFIALWRWQLDGFLPSNWVASVVAIGIGLVGYTALAGLWIAWNRNIYRRRHRRTTPLVVSPAFASDRLGRPVEGAGAARAGATWIRIEIDHERGLKRYLDASEGQPDTAPAEHVADAPKLTA